MYWALNKKEKIKTKVTEMKLLWWMCGVTKLDGIGNQHTNNMFSYKKKFKGNGYGWGNQRELRLRRFDRVKRKDYNEIVSSK